MSKCKSRVIVQRTSLLKKECNVRLQDKENPWGYAHADVKQCFLKLCKNLLIQSCHGHSFICLSRALPSFHLYMNT